MLLRRNLSSICPSKLTETYETLFELQHKLHIDDEFLLSTTKVDTEKHDLIARLRTLLEASKVTRDNLITWYLKQSLVELSVTISLLTAKIKFIEYKLGLCEGLDLHQACSLSLVNFCNILADMTVLNVEKAERKTLHHISSEVNIPVWLSHYRNQICHVPSESPCISILVPLVAKSLKYMEDSFWSKVLERKTFDAQRCRNLVSMISKFNYITSINQHMELRKDIQLGKRRLKMAQLLLIKSNKACAMLRRFLMHNPDQVVDIILNFILNYEPNDRTRNCGLLLEQIILARCFERFTFKLLAAADGRVLDDNTSAWITRVVTLIGLRGKDNIKLGLKKMNINISVKLMRLTEISPLKCCHIAHKLINLYDPITKKLVVRLRYKLAPVLGKRRTLLLIKLTKLAIED